MVFTVLLLCTSIAACFPSDFSTTTLFPGIAGSTPAKPGTTSTGTTVSTVTTVGSSAPSTGTIPVIPPTTITTAPPQATTRPQATTTSPVIPSDTVIVPGTSTTVPVIPTTAPTMPSTTLPPTVTTVPTQPTTVPTVPAPTTKPTFTTTPIVVPTTKPTEPPEPPEPPVPTGWKQENGKWYFLDQNGQYTLGFAKINGGTYYFDFDGSMHTGWLELQGKHYFFSTGGLMRTGWILHEGSYYYLNADGTMHTGWLELSGNRYYMSNDGTMYTGWMIQGGEQFYFKENGIMAKGMVVIDGVKNYFTSSGAYIMLVNPWNTLPEGYEPDLVAMTKYKNDVQQVDARCFDDLMKMLDDCKRAGCSAVVISSYRSLEKQQSLYEKRVKRFMNEGYSRAEAEVLAAQVVAVPGTSEHHLGLAVDIVDNSNWNLDESQANTKAQKWLMENSWQYGFILRYPVGKTEVTGIIYEPWHYRYVGKEVAKEIHDLGVTLEEYLQMLTDETT